MQYSYQIDKLTRDEALKMLETLRAASVNYRSTLDKLAYIQFVTKGRPMYIVSVYNDDSECVAELPFASAYEAAHVVAVAIGANDRITLHVVEKALNDNVK